ncbi:cysteine hydrolase family protein [Kitasatospora sp. CB01950]|uniref:cysteine hydrolase family protein n=1 Tax=Kitasatospora sp. CB01950 TaxID=1703930 RepID=UPI00093EFB79|nr:cysteine hydrolase [Kitasatospora sp. CB01950]OKJ16830.1 isochorismatase [Kitasatospora sp. CB01950]
MKHTALLLLDCQPAVLAALPDPAPLLARLERAAADVRAGGGTVAHVRTAFTESDWAAVPATNQVFAAVARHRVLHHDDPDAAFHPQLPQLDDDLAVRKTRLSALSGTGLDQRLRARAVDTLILAGLSTGGAVLATALDAADHDYRLRVLSDGVADPDPHLHELLLEKVLPARAELLNCSSLKAG